MFAEMTPVSSRSLEISRTEPRSKDQRRTKSSSFRNCLTVCFTAKMEQREPPLADGTERRLGELTSKWFIDTQVPLIAPNGLFPTWFLGFTSRKGAEEILRQKEPGCFLIRLSDKAIGYILSYKGSDRCRHFVINQSESGHFVISGDTEEYSTISDLIENYKTSPIQPFGEFLTASCLEGLNVELYDTIQGSNKESPVEIIPKPHITSEQPPERPPKSSRTLNEAPPLPRRGRHLEASPLKDKDRILYAQFRKQSPREIPTFHHHGQDSSPKEYPGRAERPTTGNVRRRSPTPGPERFSSELGLPDDKNLSVAFLYDSSAAERPYRLSASPHAPPRLSPKDVRQTTRCGLEKTVSYNRPSSSHSLEYLSDGGVYHLAGRCGTPPGCLLSENHSEQPRDSVYTEVPVESLTGHAPQANTYELIPGDEDAVHPKTSSNTYEPLEDIKPTHNHSTWGFKVDKWKRLFPAAKRK
ncbi:SH2 domain-containing protein 7-like [Brachionichthys hirsutus]|uniref:SH2 domain-containing protein 7-like n=1 Tax=Brachionichthys hirsutus TaxID=412623 RepID=UPI00360547F2